MKRFWTLITLLLFAQFSYAQCPGCIVDLPSLPEDTIFLGMAPDGQANAYYEADVSFRMPKTTTPVSVVDPDIPPGLTIDDVEITGVTGLPLGMEWEANQTFFEVATETDGCVRLCGTPLVSDSFFVLVNLNATVFGITQTASFEFPLYIGPATTTNDGFSMSNNIACGSTTVDFTNNVPSDGQTGYAYTWDFGNNTSSTDENPAPVTYSEPGIYEVNFAATIDTTGTLLTGVTVLNSDCGDINIPPFNNPDLYIRIENPSGGLLYQSPIQDNVVPPTVFSIVLPIGPGDYTLEVIDDDLIGEQSCGTVTFNQSTSGILVDEELEVEVDLVTPMTIIQTVDTVFVYEIPATPSINADPTTAISCDEEPVILSTNYDENLQWFNDTVLLLGATNQSLMVTESGNYFVEFTSTDGCTVQSDMILVGAASSPPSPVFSANSYLLTLDVADVLPIDFTVQWFLEDEAINGANDLSYCMTESGSYGLEVTDLTTGCTSLFIASQSFDPDGTCTTNTEEALREIIQLYPNPASDWVTITGGFTFMGYLELVNVRGQQVWQAQGPIDGFSVAHLPPGLYWIRAFDTNQALGTIPLWIVR
ncbi:MAG: PKD domain-containing protein [Bacteroidota bacterium]